MFDALDPLADSLSREVVMTVREWRYHWHQLYLQRETAKFEAVHLAMNELIHWRRQLLSSTCTTEEAKNLKASIVDKIDWGNDLLGLDLVPRVSYEPVDTDSLSALELLELHRLKTDKKRSSTNSEDIKGKNVKSLSIIFFSLALLTPFS